MLEHRGSTCLADTLPTTVILIDLSSVHVKGLYELFSTAVRLWKYQVSRDAMTGDVSEGAFALCFKGVSDSFPVRFR